MVDAVHDSPWLGPIAIGFRADGQITGDTVVGDWPEIAGAETLLLATFRADEPCWALVAGGDLIAVHPRGADYPSEVGAAAAAAVVAAAQAAWYGHVEQVRARLAASYGATEITDQPSAPVQVAWAASDIDASALQITADGSARAHRQAVVRARAAVDQLLGDSRRHGLDASDPVTVLWQTVHSGSRHTLRFIDALELRSIDALEQGGERSG